MINIANFSDAGPYHRFFVFEDSISFPEAFKQACSRKRDAKVVFPDDWLRYFHDFTMWIPTTFFINKSIINAMGLDYEGWSIIATSGKEQADLVVRALIDLLRCGPPLLVLRGPFNEKEQDYDKLNVKKQILIELLENLHSAILDIENHKFVLHLGI